jgi:probable HAF family extracellular repeat protein
LVYGENDQRSILKLTIDGVQIMKTYPRSEACNIFLAVTLNTALVFAVPAAAAQSASFLVDLDSKTVTMIGTLGGSSSSAYGLNDLGQVVGSSSTASGKVHAFMTGPNGQGMTDLGAPSGGSSTARDINNFGQVAGTSYSGEEVSDAFVTGPNGIGIKSLSLIGGYHTAVHVGGINESGQVTGWHMDKVGHYSFITGPNGEGMTVLDGFASGINDAGQIVGESGSPSFITGPNGVGITYIDNLPGGQGSSEVSGVNNSGQVVGWSVTQIENESYDHAFITGPGGTGITDLGTLQGYQGSYATGINNEGQVVGWVGDLYSDSGNHAFVTGPNGKGMTDLNDLVDMPKGYVLDQAVAINNQGQVIANASIVPELQTYALMLAGLALLRLISPRKLANI